MFRAAGVNIDRGPRMATIHLSGTTLPERYGEVRNGLAAVVDNPGEVDALIALCTLAPRPPEDPLTSVYRSLESPSLNLATWAAYWKDLISIQSTQSRIPAASSWVNKHDSISDNDD